MKTNDALSLKNMLISDWRNLLLPSMEEKIQRARQSVNEFAACCCTDSSGQPLRQAALHRDLQGFLERQRRALIELPRDHGKSVQICLRILWELGHDPSLRVKVVCASDAMAVERCRFLRDAIAFNPWLHKIFPKLKPAQPWGAIRFTIQRPANAIGPSVAALGVGSVATGTRADLLVCDDIVDVKSLRSRADRERVKSHFHENLMNLLEPTGRFWGLFTPWHVDDLNSTLKRNPAYALFRRAVGPNLEPVWPEKWPTERLEERQKEIGSMSFARAYRLVCVAEEEVPIRAEWVRFWTNDGVVDGREDGRWRMEDRNNAAPYSILHPPSSIRSGYEWVVLAVDPAVSVSSTADRTGVVTLGKTGDGEIHCLEAIGRRVTAPEMVAFIDEADRRWEPDVILFESNAAFAGIRDLLVRHARFGPKIKSVIQTKDKMSRAHAFSVCVENGTFRLRGDGERRGVSPPCCHPGQQELFDEMTSFPYGQHDDLLDAAMSAAAEMMGRREPRVW